MESLTVHTGQSDHHADVVHAPLHALGFLPIEGLSHLPGEKRLGHSQLGGPRLQAELQFVLAVVDLRPSGADAAIGFQQCLHALSDLRLLRRSRPTQFEIQVAVGVLLSAFERLLGIDTEKLRLRDRPDQLSPPVGKDAVSRAGDTPLRRIGDFDRKLSRGLAETAARVGPANDAHDVADERLAGARIHELPLHLLQRGGDPIHVARGHLERRVLREHYHGGDPAGVH